jgi:hypothetical protein
MENETNHSQPTNQSTHGTSWMMMNANHRLAERRKQWQTIS